MSSLIPDMQDLDPDGQPPAGQTRHHHERRVRADSARRLVAPRESPGARMGRRAGAQARAARAAHSSPRCAAPPRRCWPSTPRMRAPAAAADSSRSPTTRRSDAQLAAARAGQARIHLRRAGPFRESDRRLDEAPAARREAAAVSEDAMRPRQTTRRARLSELHRARRVHQGRVPGFGYGPDGAELRAFDARRRAAHHRGSHGDARHRREDGGLEAADAARPREPQPAGRRRGHGAPREVRRRRLQDLHAVGTERRGLLDDRRRRRRLRREGAQARRAQHLHSQGPRLRPEELRALDLPRHRSDREAVSRT